MSEVEKLEAEVEIKSAAYKFHELYSCRPHTVNTMTPHNVQGCHLHHGQFGEPGSVICWNYTLEGEKKVAKEIVEEIDDVNFSTRFKVIEGDVLKEYKMLKIIVKATPKEGEEGSVVQWSLEYQKMNPQTPHPNSILDLLISCTKDVDTNLLFLITSGQ